MATIRLPALLAALTLAGCDDHLFPAAGGSSEDCDPTWAGVQVFMGDNCLTCHGGPDAPSGGGIVFPDQITADMNDLSTPLYPQYGGELVVPSNRESSVLWLAASHTGSADVPSMPIGSVDPIPGFECIGTWIDNGALLDE
jgi:hypothetical protein